MSHNADQAIEYYQKSLNLMLASNNNNKRLVKIQETMINLANAYVQRSLFDKANEIIEELIQVRENDELHASKLELLPLYQKLFDNYGRVGQVQKKNQCLSKMI